VARKICFVTGTLSQGGAERQLYYMLRVLSEAGNSLTVLCLTRQEYWESAIRDLGASVVWVGQRKSRPSRFLRILAEVRRLRPDVIQSSHFYTNFPAAVVGRLLGIPVVGALRNDGLMEISAPGRVLGMLNLKAPRWIAANSKAGIANACRLGVAKHRLRFLPNAVDVSEFRAAETELRSPVRILTAGRLVDQKRQDRFVRLIHCLRSTLALPVKGVLVGDGPNRDALKNLACDLRLTEHDIEFCGSRKSMADVYGQADLFVLTSAWEGTPNVVLEAMASGVPVVSTDVGDVRELVHDGTTGFVVPADDEQELVVRVRQLVEDSTLRQAFARNARRHVESSFSLSRLGTNLEALYSAVAA
jgi:glycosyltransferase involved in cell wall biosynthesis